MNAPELRLSRVREGLPYPRGATWDGKGVNFALFSANATKVEVCLFDRDGKETRTHRAARVPRRDLARLCAGHRPGHVLRLPRARALRAGRRPPLQPEQAGARSLCARAVRRAEVGSRALRLQGRRPAGRSVVRRARQRALHAEVRGGRPGLRLEAREGVAAGAVGPRPSSTRRTCAAIPSCIPRCPSTSAAPTPASRSRRSSTTSSRSASPRSSCCRCTPSSTTVPARAKLTNYWGYNSIGFFAPDPRYAADPSKIAAGIQGDGGALPRRRARGHHRRGLQPYRRRQRARADAVLQGHRQRLLLPPDAGQEALLHQRHRHRQHAQSLAPAGDPDGVRQPALLGRGDARRRLPLRPRHHPRARARRLRYPQRLHEGGDAGSACSPR